MMSTDSEMVLLGARLRSSDNIPILFDGLNEDDFSLPKHKAIFRAIKSLEKKKAPIDPITLSNELKIHGTEISPSEVIELEDSYIDGIDLQYYIDQIKILSKRRKLQSSLSLALKEVQNPAVEYSELKEQITQNVIAILDDEKDRRNDAIEKIEINEFPKEAIQGLAKEFADTFSEYLESPWSFWAFSFLTCLGSILSDRLTLDSAIKPQPRINTFLLGRSADERKSECEKQTIDFFSVFQDFHPCYGVGSAEGLAERLKKFPKTLLVYDEAKVFVSKAMLEASVLLPCVNTLFESNRFHSHTKGHSIEVDNGYLSILAASTLDTFQRMWTSAFTDIGFINRLWLDPDKAERKFSIPSSMPENIKKGLQEKLLTLLNAIPKDQKVLEITPEAFQVFDEWYRSTPQTIFTKRLDTYGLRFMILFCANENKTKVTPDITKRVIDLLEWQRRVREENDVIDAEGKIARMEEGIRRAVRKNPQGVTRRDLQRMTNSNRAGIFVWNTALKNLQMEEIYYDPRRQVYRFKGKGV
jgi:hypothetical protein